MMVCYPAMRRWSALLLFSIATATSIVGSETPHVFPRPTGYVNDFANVVDGPRKINLLPSVLR
jgi:hypothetical protein